MHRVSAGPRPSRSPRATRAAATCRARRTPGRPRGGAPEAIREHAGERAADRADRDHREAGKTRIGRRQPGGAVALEQEDRRPCPHRVQLPHVAEVADVRKRCGPVPQRLDREAPVPRSRTASVRRPGPTGSAARSRAHRTRSPATRWWCSSRPPTARAAAAAGASAPPRTRRTTAPSRAVRREQSARAGRVCRVAGLMRSSDSGSSHRVVDT